jgi:hypothetical protein
MHGLVLPPPHLTSHAPSLAAPSRPTSHPQVQVLRGRVLYEGMQYKEAAAAFETARKLDPTCLEVSPHKWVSPLPCQH